jgi:hypothetical protein
MSTGPGFTPSNPPPTTPATAPALPAAPAATAKAPQQNTLTLSCKGTTTFFPGGKKSNADEPEDVSMGIIFNFDTGEVAGFDNFGGGPYYHAKIAGINDVMIYFKGGDDEKPFNFLEGSIDRVTGELDASTSALLEKEISSITIYHLHCTPTQRMF